MLTSEEGRIDFCGSSSSISSSSSRSIISGSCLPISEIRFGVAVACAVARFEVHDNED